MSYLVCVLSLQSWPTLCDSKDCGLPGFSLPGILQTGLLEWVAMSSSRGSSWPRDGACVSCLLHWQVGSLPLEPHGNPCLVLIEALLMHYSEYAFSVLLSAKVLLLFGIYSKHHNVLEISSYQVSSHCRPVVAKLVGSCISIWEIFFNIHPQSTYIIHCLHVLE